MIRGWCTRLPRRVESRRESAKLIRIAPLFFSTLRQVYQRASKEKKNLYLYIDFFILLCGKRKKKKYIKEWLTIFCTLLKEIELIE